MGRRPKHLASQPKTFGERLRAIRLARGLSQRDVGDALGFDASYISRIETGKVTPPPEIVDQLKEALGLSHDEYIDLLKLLKSEKTGAGVLGPLQVPTELLQIQTFLSGLFSPRLLRQLVVDPEEKNALGHFLSDEIVQLCQPGKRNPVIFDSGTTCAFIAFHLGITAPYGLLLDVFTSNLLVALYLMQKARVYLLGGRLDPEFGATLGSETLEQTRDVLAYLNQQPSDESSSPLGILACLAFTPHEGPYARKQDLPNLSKASSEGVTLTRSRHMRMKALLISSVPDLVLPLTSEKLIRSELAAWRPIAAPIDSGGERVWQMRLAGKTPRDCRTHIVFALPVEGLMRERVIRAIKSLIEDPIYPFCPVATLFGRADKVTDASRFVTAFDLRHYRPLSPEELKELL